MWAAAGDGGKLRRRGLGGRADDARARERRLRIPNPPCLLLLHPAHPALPAHFARPCPTSPDLARPRPASRSPTRLGRTLMTRWTIGISLSCTLNTTMSPERNGVNPMCRNKMSPRWNAGSMLRWREGHDDCRLSRMTGGRSIAVRRGRLAVRLGGALRCGAKVFQHLPERTTTTGLSEDVTTMSDFQIIKAEHTIIERLRTWCASCGRTQTASGGG